jgi:hypothetical protein
VQSRERLMRLLGLLSPIAVRLLQLRDLSRDAPARPAWEVIEPQSLLVLAARTAQSPSTMTVGTFWIQVARLGGASFPSR